VLSMFSYFSLFAPYKLLSTKGDTFHFKGIPSNQSHEMRRDMTIVKLQEQIRNLTKELEEVRGSAQQNPYQRGYDVNPIDITYSSS